MYNDIQNSEKYLEKKIAAAVKKAGGISVKFLPFSFAGFPDRLCFLPGGRLVIIEVKSKGKRPSPRQRVVIDQLRVLGFDVRVIDSYEAFLKFETDTHA